MRLTVILLLISFVFAKSVAAQSDELLIQGQTGSLYLEHTVAAKENWYSVGRLYNISPKEIASFNNLAITQSLGIGQQLKIPLTAANFSQNGVKTPAESLIPVYHVVQDKEWMYRVSVNHNRVPIPSLEKWNNINKDQVKAGMHLIVGYLKVKTALSALATSSSAAPAVASSGTAPAAPVTTTAPPPPPPATSGTPVNPAVTAPATTAVTGGAKTETPVTPAATTTTNSAPPVVKETPKPVVHTTPTPTPAATPATPAINFNGGYFKGDFSDGSKTVSGTAGIFKSTSGWQDGKYYALMNNVAVGTIIKIIVPATGKSVFVKVLGQLPDMKESVGLTVRLSNAAASELGESEARFAVDVRY